MFLFFNGWPSYDAMYNTISLSLEIPSLDNTDNEYSAIDCRLVYQRAALVKLIKTQIHPHTLIIDHAIAT